MKSKFVKIAALGLSLAVAASTASLFTGCIPGVKTDYSQKVLKVNLDSEGRLYWRNNTELKCNIGYETKNDTAISFSTQNNLTNTGAEVTLPDGKVYTDGDLKPAWSALEEKLKLKLTDSYVPLKSDASINSLITDEDDEKIYRDENGNLVSDEANCLWDFDIITGSCAAIQNVQGVSDKAKFLDLSLYLDYMPNYREFLNRNPLIYLSLVTDTKTGAMYYAPYFDGNDDVEKYTIIQKSWAEKLLDAEDYDAVETKSFKQQADAKNAAQTSISTKSSQTGDNVVIDGTASSITSFMGTSGRWQIDVIDPSDSRMSKVVKVTVNYDNALRAARDDEQSPLYQAILEAAGKPYSGESGNIVDLQNFVINETHGEVKGAQLLKILQNYIDVTYTSSRDNQPFYSQKGLKRSDIFCGASAAWDVDILAAFGRCVVTCMELLGDSVSQMQTESELYAFGGRSSFTQRIADMYAFAGELYGVRGLESRYEFTYINEEGKVCDARENPAAWEAMNNLSRFAREGLMYTGDAVGTDRSVYSTKSTNRGPVYFLEHDYVQTQTLYQMRLEEDVAKGTYQIQDDYNFSPIITAVSRWNDGNQRIMRFTESWRSVKNTGFCVPYQSVSDNPERLSAILAFIDYFFSEDGQILMTYGPQSTNGNENPNGWWYAEEDTTADLTDNRKFRKISDATYYLDAQYQSLDGTCFVYEGKVYKGLDYAGRSIPILTDDNINCFKGKTFGGDHTIGAYTLNYTDYARKVIGSALPIGNKDQGFEYQCTSQCGLEGASIVDAAINKAGIIKHTYLQVDNPEHNLWYVIMPTLLPLSSEASEFLKGDNQKAIDALFVNNSSTPRNSFVRVMYNGFSNGTFDGSASMPSNAEGVLALLEDLDMSARTGYVDEAWQRLYLYYDANIKDKV